MSRKYAIHWRPADELDLRRAVRNANKRRRAAIKRYGGADWLPPAFEYKKIRESIYTRDDLKRALKSLSEFTAKAAAPVTNQHGVTTSVWQANELKKKIRRENARRARDAKKRSEYVNGKKITTPEEKQKEAEAREIKKDFQDISNAEDWQKFIDYVDSLTDKKRYKDDPEEYAEKIIEALDRRGIDDDIVRSFYDSIKNNLADYEKEGFFFANLKSIYDPAVESDSKIEKVKLEIPIVLDREGKRAQEKFIDGIGTRSNVSGDPELQDLWEFLGYEHLYNAWKQGYNITYPDDLYNYINKDDELKAKWDALSEG